MTFQLTILGANSATPAYGRHQTSQLLTIGTHSFLLDCGEGCQMQLMRYQSKISRINHILISHLHGDHFFGLIGLLNTMSLGGHRQPLHLYAPPGLAEVITALLRCSHTVLSFPLQFHALESPGNIYEDLYLTIETIAMDHGVPCFGFVFREKPKPRRINKETLPPDLTVPDILLLKEGKDVYDADGHLRYKNEALTLPPRRSRTYAYCSDTRYNERIIPLLEGIDLLYHEATFMQDQADKAAVRYHSTTLEAATIARKARVGQLLIGHYSSRYREIEPLLEEAQTVFANTQLAIEGQTYTLED